MPPEDEPKQISPKEAAEAASKFFRESTGSAAKIVLEEVELKQGYWYVTLGIYKDILYDAKEYKVFKVHITTGAVESMKIKE